MHIVTGVHTRTQGYRHRHNFIVTQAPLQDTVGDFWRMVWEHKSAAIIMLTQLEEGGQVGGGTDCMLRSKVN